VAAARTAAAAKPAATSGTAAKLAAAAKMTVGFVVGKAEHVFFQAAEEREETKRVAATAVAAPGIQRLPSC
jgi:ABC-type sugar transport system substrate-binding protein